ncbi:MAG: nuclear transport factor 2 family protein [Solirubrobacteraceae bacterium]
MTRDTDPRAEIENMLARYAWAFDTNDLDCLRDCFTPDAEFEVSGGGVTAGRDAVVAELARLRARHQPAATTPWHLVSTLWIVSTGADTVSARSRFMLVVSEREGPPALVSVGWYSDEIVNSDGAWRLRRRRVLRPHEA